MVTSDATEGVDKPVENHEKHEGGEGREKALGVVWLLTSCSGYGRMGYKVKEGPTS